MVEKPIRIQRRPTKGWRMPPNTVSVTRPGRWGNPFNWRQGLEMGSEGWAKGAAVELFRDWLRHPESHPNMPGPPTISVIRGLLRGKNLACYCALDSPCHADVLLEIANS